jgi:mannose-6-phosphate isomerase
MAGFACNGCFIVTNVIEYIEWVRTRSVPAWAAIGFDRDAGRFHERLDFAGHPLAVPCRAMVQARQIYVFAHAARLGWFPEGGLLAERAMHRLMHDFSEAHNGSTRFTFSIDPYTSAVVSSSYDSYTHAFILFALAHLYQLTGERTLLETAEQTTRFLDQHMLDDVHGGHLDDAMLRQGAKRQNPQMHMLEAYLALHEVAPDKGYAERAGALVTLFYDKLFHPEHGVLIEHFAHNWAPHPSPEKRDRFEPGHHYEWVWLLKQHERAHPGADHSAWCEHLYATAREHGSASGSLIYDELSADRRLIKTSHRLWPHTEAIKAATMRAIDGKVEAELFADDMAGTLLRHFLNGPFDGGWIDHVSSDLRPLIDYVPASSLYHLFLAASEAQALRIDQPQRAGGHRSGST